MIYALAALFNKSINAREHIDANLLMRSLYLSVGLKLHCVSCVSRSDATQILVIPGDSRSTFLVLLLFSVSSCFVDDSAAVSLGVMKCHGP